MWAWRASTGCLAGWIRFSQADVVIVIAGMEGALASVVGGLVEVPVIAGTDQRRLRREFWRAGSASLHAELLR